MNMSEGYAIMGGWPIPGMFIGGGIVDFGGYRPLLACSFPLTWLLDSVFFAVVDAARFDLPGVNTAAFGLKEKALAFGFSFTGALVAGVCLEAPSAVVFVVTDAVAVAPAAAAAATGGVRCDFCSTDVDSFVVAESVVGIFCLDFCSSFCF